MARIEQLNIRHDGDHVLLIVNGVCVADMPWQIADQLSAGLRAKARVAEAWEKKEKVWNDATVLKESGAPLPVVKLFTGPVARFAGNELPGGIDSSEVAEPRVLQLPPPVGVK
jgi:hypothetical protein